MPPRTRRSETLAQIRGNAATERATATRHFLLAARWADDSLDPEQPTSAGECLDDCASAGRGDEHGDFNGSCAGGCHGDPHGFSARSSRRRGGTPPRPTPRRSAGRPTPVAPRSATR